MVLFNPVLSLSLRSSPRDSNHYLQSSSRNLAFLLTLLLAAIQSSHVNCAHIWSLLYHFLHLQASLTATAVLTVKTSVESMSVANCKFSCFEDSEYSLYFN